MAIKGKIARIEITKQTTANGEPARVGDVIDVPEADARYLIGTNRAVEAEGKKPVKQGKPSVASSKKKDDKETAPTT